MDKPVKAYGSLGTYSILLYVPRLSFYYAGTASLRQALAEQSQKAANNISKLIEIVVEDTQKALLGVVNQSKL